MLRWRLLLGTLIVAALAGLFLLDHLAPVPGILLIPLALALTVALAAEVLYLERSSGMHPLPAVVYGGSLLLVAGNWAGPIVWRFSTGVPLAWPVLPWDNPVSALVWAPLGLAIGMLAALVGEMCRYRKPATATANAAASVFALIYVGLLLSFVVQLRMIWGIGALASLVIVVKLGDIGAYTVGRLAGRHKMAPVISPAKTVEGAIGGLAVACLGSWATFRWLLPALAPKGAPSGPWWGWIAFGVLVGTAGMVGDLAESVLKRDAGKKDSSNWMPGFGGVLDILDSLLLAAPVAWLCWLWGLVGR